MTIAKIAADLEAKITEWQPLFAPTASPTMRPVPLVTHQVEHSPTPGAFMGRNVGST